MERSKSSAPPDRRGAAASEGDLLLPGLPVPGQEDQELLENPRYTGGRLPDGRGHRRRVRAQAKGEGSLRRLPDGQRGGGRASNGDF